MNPAKVIGIDLGATNLRAGLVNDAQIFNPQSKRIPRLGTVEEVLADFYKLIEQLIRPEVVAIGVGVPGVLDIENGIVYDVQHIPSWREVRLKQIL